MPIQWTEAARQIQDAMLRLFASCTNCSIGLYEPHSGGRVGEVLPVTDVNPYCAKLWTLPEGERLCRADHIKRAQQIVDGQESTLTLCYAGLFNQALPILQDGEVKAVLMYGQMWVRDHHLGTEARTLHNRAIQRLSLSEDDELELRVYYDETSQLSKTNVSLLDDRLSLLQQLFYEMLSEQQGREKEVEGLIHDLQTRLQPILALAENLYHDLRWISRDNPTFDNLQSDADALLKSALAMRVLVGNLDSFMPEYQFRSCALDDLVEEVVGLYRAEAERKQVAIETWLEDPSITEMSRTHLQQAISNLLHNAIKYSYRGGPGRYRYVEVSGKTNRSYYALTFSNFGVGILPEEYQLIFEPKYRGKLTQGEYRTGAGKGLAIAKEIIEKHHGTIEVESTKTGGDAYVTKFHVHLPTKQLGKEDRK